MDQPQSQANHHPAIWDLVIRDMQRRDQVGLDRYGTRLQPHNGRRCMQDLYEELLDAAVYTRQAIFEQAYPEIDTVYLDMDGVLVDFVSGALQAHGAGPEKMVAGEYCMEKWLGISIREFWKPLGGESFWRFLPWTTDGLSILQLVLDHVSSEHVWLASQPSLSPGSWSGKQWWVQTNMSEFTRRLILIPNKSLLARPGALLIDDKDENVQAWRQRGGEAILLPRPWNRLHQHAAHALTILATYLLNLFPRLSKTIRAAEVKNGPG